MNFQWAVQQMKAGKKVRCKSWQDKDSFLFVKNGLVYCHKERKAYFFLDSFEAIDWELFEEIDLINLDNGIKEFVSANHITPTHIRMNERTIEKLKMLNFSKIGRPVKVLGLEIIEDNNLDDNNCIVYNKNYLVPIHLEKEEKFYCQHCKSEVKFGDKFCKNCGRTQLWALFG